MYVTAIVLAAGKGLRFESGVSKPLVGINSKPVIIYCLNTLSLHHQIKDIIVAANSENLRNIISKIRQYRIKKVKDVILGGRKRCGSVSNALRVIDSRTDLVLIHDAVRPFICREDVSGVIRVAERYGAAILGVPVKATIKKVKSQKSLPGRQAGKVKSEFMVERTLNRDSLWEIQTPQAFRTDIILKAYEKFGNINATDDAFLVEKLGIKVRMAKGSYFNIKITTPEDLIIAQAIAKTL